MTHHTKTQRLASILLTVAVIGILLLAGPAQAVTLGFGTPSHTVAPAGTTITFDTTVEVTADEIIPITTVTLKVNGVDCVFPVEGGASISPDAICQGLTIERDETVGAYQYSQNLNGYGYNYGYGYSYSYGYGYGYGYDYGYGYGSQRLALRYHVTWDTTLYAPDVYSFHFLVNANEGDFSYSTDEPLVITITGGSSEGFAAFSTGSSGGGSGGGGGGGCMPGYIFVKSDGRCYKAEEVPLALPPASEGGDSDGGAGNQTEKALVGDNVETVVEGDEKNGGNLLTGAIAGFLTGTSWLWLLLLVILIAALLAYWMAKKNN